ncbi:unnamed protein product [Penicillium camemberti]|uniref:Str. FM013 n=1 Tax=Penicillium camemberti (strain FM 013) TaxID=1429867 RepID=A0A0G4PP43_PENC3|nr:unnamed protein product [Penicillium camemberti]
MPIYCFVGVLYWVLSGQVWSSGRIFTGTLIFKDNDAPRYVLGFIVAATSFVAGVTVLIYRLVCVLENRKRDQVWDGGGI